MTFRWRKVVKIKDMSCQGAQRGGWRDVEEGWVGPDQEAEEELKREEKRKRPFRF